MNTIMPTNMFPVDTDHIGANGLTPIGPVKSWRLHHRAGDPMITLQIYAKVSETPGGESKIQVHLSVEGYDPDYRPYQVYANRQRWVTWHGLCDLINGMLVRGEDKSNPLKLLNNEEIGTIEAIAIQVAQEWATRAIR